MSTKWWEHQHPSQVMPVEKSLDVVVPNKAHRPPAVPGSSEVVPRKRLSLPGDLEHLVAGTIGGVCSTLVVHPLDLLKIRFAVNEGNPAIRPQYVGYFGLARTVLRERGILGFYQGVSPNLAGHAVAWGMYFLLYNKTKMALQDWHGKRLGMLDYIFAGMLSGALTLTVTNPLWVAKTRLCLEYEGQNRRYVGLLDTLRKLYRTSGIRGLYQGYVPGLFGTSHGAIQFLIYEELQSVYRFYTDSEAGVQLPTSVYLGASASSKIMATSMTYPYQVIRLRLQDQHVKYVGIGDVVRKTWARESLAGFYKGLVPSLLRVTPATAITFVVYETVRNNLQTRYGEHR